MIPHIMKVHGMISYSNLTSVQTCVLAQGGAPTHERASPLEMVSKCG